MSRNHQIAIGEHICEIFRKTRSLLVDETPVEQIRSSIKELRYLHHSMQDWEVLVSNMINECQAKETELKMEEELKAQISHLELAFNTKNHDDSMKFLTMSNKKMSWAEMTEFEENREECIQNIDHMIENMHNPPSTKHISTINGVNITSENLAGLSIPIAETLSDIEPSLYWFIGDDHHPSGIYMNLCKHYVQIPFPNTIDGTQNTSRNSTIKCKYTTLNDCYANREALANRFHSEVRACNFAHVGDQYVKIGTSCRCPGAPGLGSHATLNEDMQKANFDDIKMLLMYSTSDILLSSIWLQNHVKIPKIISNLGVC